MIYDASGNIKEWFRLVNSDEGNMDDRPAAPVCLCWRSVAIVHEGATGKSGDNVVLGGDHQVLT